MCLGWIVWGDVLRVSQTIRDNQGDCYCSCLLMCMPFHSQVTFMAPLSLHQGCVLSVNSSHQPTLSPAKQSHTLKSLGLAFASIHSFSLLVSILIYNSTPEAMWAMSCHARVKKPKHFFLLIFFFFFSFFKIGCLSLLGFYTRHGIQSICYTDCFEFRIIVPICKSLFLCAMFVSQILVQLPISILILYQSLDFVDINW